MNWFENCFDGPPPLGYRDWMEWIQNATETHTIRGVYIRAATVDDFQSLREKTS